MHSRVRRISVISRQSIITWILKSVEMVVKNLTGKKTRRSKQLTHSALRPAGFCILEVPPRFELGVELLQSSALPLGYGTGRNAGRSGKKWSE